MFLKHQLQKTILKTEEETQYMIANGLSPGFPFLTHDFQPNHNFSGNMNNSTNDVLFKADGSIIIDSNINNHNSIYPSLYYKYYVNSSKNVNMFLKTTKKPSKTNVSFIITFNGDFNTLTETQKNTIIAQLKVQFSAKLDVPESDITITLTSGSIKVNVTVSTTKPTQITPIIENDLPNETYSESLGTLNKSLSFSVKVKTIVSDPIHPLLIEPGFLLTNNTYRTSLTGHIGEIAEKCL